MVEEIESIDAELHTIAARDGEDLADREIRVVECRADDDVPPQVAEARDRHERRGIEPLVDRADDVNRRHEIWTHRIRHAV